MMTNMELMMIGDGDGDEGGGSGSCVKKTEAMPIRTTATTTTMPGEGIDQSINGELQLFIIPDCVFFFCFFFFFSFPSLLSFFLLLGLYFRGRSELPIYRC